MAIVYFFKYIYLLIYLFSWVCWLLGWLNGIFIDYCTFKSHVKVFTIHCFVRGVAVSVDLVRPNPFCWRPVVRMLFVPSTAHIACQPHIWQLVLHNWNKSWHIVSCCVKERLPTYSNHRFLCFETFNSRNWNQ